MSVMDMNVTRRWTVLLAVLTLLVSMPLAGPAPAMADTNVSGDILGDVTWTASGSPYVLTGDVTVTYGATLTVEPGVTIQGHGHAIETYGDLAAVGTTDSPVIVRDTTVRGRGRYIFPSIVESFTITLEHADVDEGTLQGGGFSMYGSWILRDSIVSNAEDQMYLWYPRADSSIERTIFLNGGKVSAGVHEANVFVDDSIFWRYNADAPVRDQAVEAWASFGGYGVFAHGNSFLNPGMPTAALPTWSSSGSLDATSNWWSTTVTSTVGSMIFDLNDDAGCPGYIPYAPLLTAPSPDAPHARLPLATTVAIAASPTTILLGESSKVDATITDARGAAEFGVTASIASSPDGSSWTTIDSAVTDADGNVEFDVTPASDTIYRVSAGGVAGVYETAISGNVAVDVSTPTTVDVERISGADRYSVAVTAARRASDPSGNRSWPGVTDVIIASGEDRAAADPLASAGLSWAYENAPLFLTLSNDVPDSVVQAIGEVAVANGTGANSIAVHIVGGAVSVPSARFQQLESEVRSRYGSTAANALKYDRLTIDGDRYDLARTIALRMKSVKGGAMPARALMANGQDNTKFFDALALSPISANTGAPILLVGKDYVPSQTTRTLSDLGVPNGERYIAGGSGSVSEDARKKLGVPSGNRLWGQNRYDTAKKVADTAVSKGWLDAKTTGVAAKLPDALTGGSMTGGQGGALLITATEPLSGPASTYLRVHAPEAQKVWVFGGTKSVTVTTFRQIEDAVD